MKTSMFRLGLMGMALFVVSFVLGSCSDDDKDSEGTKKYVVQAMSYSDGFNAASGISEKVSDILKSSSPATGYFEATALGANDKWQEVCDSIRNYDWAGQDYLVPDSVWVEVALTEYNSSGSGNQVVGRRKVYLPSCHYGIKTSNGSNLYELNVKAKNAVNKIIAAFNNNGETTFLLKRSDALARLDVVADSILNYNWKTNDFAIQRGTSFDLVLIGGPTSVEVGSWPAYKTHTVTLPHY